MISKLSGRTFKPHLVLLILVACVLAHPGRLRAQITPAAQQTARDSIARDSTAKLRAVQITAKRGSETRVAPLQLLTLPVTASITAQKAKETVNLVDPEDAVKYLPSLYIRKRNYGDTQATIGTRVWGVSSSARSLVYADGVPLSALIANNNTIGGPRWGLISPEEISRIDIMYGPYSAAYPGNSMGAVMEITTRQPSSLEGSVQQTQALQHYNLYGTDRTFGTSLTDATVGDRFGRFSFWASGSYENSQSQPLLYVTSSNLPAGATGGYASANKLGAPTNVTGASGLLHTGMTNGKIKLAYDITPVLRAAYTIGVGHHRGRIRGNTVSMKCRLYQPALAQMERVLAGQEAFAEEDLDAFEPAALVKVLIVRNQNVPNDGRIVCDKEMLTPHAQIGDVAVLLGQVREEREWIAPGPVRDRSEKRSFRPRWKNPSRR